MNRLDFNQSIGFPLETEILDEMQKAYNIFNALGNVVGNISIISGCETVGSTVANGVVFIDGELLPFVGGTITPNVIIVENVQTREFEDNSTHDVIFTRYVTFGTATTQWAWSTFKRGVETKSIPDLLTPLLERITALEARPESNIPIGMIAIWGQALGLIPTGWAEYEPLKGRMPVGLDSTKSYADTLLQYGGANMHTNTVAEMPVHKHGIGTVNHNAAGGGSERTVVEGGSILDNTANAGSGTPWDIMNPYRVVHFIQYVGV